MSKNHVNLSNAQPGKYKEIIEKIGKDGVCPFCSENLKNYHKNPILKEGKFWLVTENMYPYKNSKVHVLFINKEHITDLSQIEIDSWNELFLLFKEFAEKYKALGGTFMMRFGNTEYTGASVSHLHAHLVSGDPTNPNRELVLARVG